MAEYVIINRKLSLFLKHIENIINSWLYGIFVRKYRKRELFYGTYIIIQNANFV